MGIHAHKSTKTSTTVQTPGAGGVCGAGKRANCIIDRVPGLRAAMGDMDSGQQRALRDAVGEIAVATREREMEHKRKNDVAAKEADRKAKKRQAGEKKEAKAHKQQLKAQAAEDKRAQAAELKSLKAVATQAAGIKRALRPVIRMNPGHISTALRDTTGVIHKAFRDVKENLNTIGAIPEYVSPATGQAPKWALKATADFREAFRAIDFIDQTSRDPFASALHVDEAFNIKAHAAWAGIGLDDEPDLDSASDSDSGSDSEDDEPAENELDDEGGCADGDGGCADGDGKRRCVEPAMLPPLMPADFAAIAAHNADGEWTYEAAPVTPPPGPGSGDEKDMPDLP